MKIFLSSLVALVLLWPSWAGAGIVNNSGTTAEDSLTVQFTMLDSLGNPVASVTGDSAWIYAWYPSGALAWRDSLRILNDGKIIRTAWKAQSRVMEVLSYQNSIANIDGAGKEGTYKYTFVAFDSSLNLATTYVGEFQVYAGPDASANFSDKFDSVTQIPDGEITAAGIATGAIGVDEWAAEADNNGINWGDIDNKTTIVDLTQTTIAGATTVGVDLDNLVGTLDASEIGTNAIGADELAPDAIGSSELAATAVREIADSVWRKLWTDAIAGGATSAGGVLDDHVVDSMLEASQVGAGASAIWTDTLVTIMARLAEILDTLKVYDNAGQFQAEIAAILADTTFVMANAGDSAFVSRMLKRNWGGIIASGSDSTTVAQRTVTAPSATVTAGNMGSIADSVWAKDTSNTLWNGLLNKFGEWNAQAQTGAGGSATCDCGNGAQTVTIKVADTSGTYTVVPNAKVSIIVGGTSVWAITNGSGIATLYMDPATYTVYAYSNGYSFTAKSIIVPGASYADSILGYDIGTNVGAAVPSSQQVQLYDWAISPANDTMYQAKVSITLVGSDEFYTSTNLVPAATVVIYTGANDGSANGGKWAETIFGTDSLFAPGGVAATYHVKIEGVLLQHSGMVVEYDALVIPASTTPTRLRTIVAGQ